MLAGRTRHVYRHSRFYRISPGGPPGDRCLAEETQNRCRTETHQVSVRETLLSSRKKHMALCQRHASVKSPGPAKSTFRGDTEENGIDSGYKSLPGSSMCLRIDPVGFQCPVAWAVHVRNSIRQTSTSHSQSDCRNVREWLSPSCGVPEGSVS